MELHVSDLETKVTKGSERLAKLFSESKRVLFLSLCPFFHWESKNYIITGDSENSQFLHMHKGLNILPLYYIITGDSENSQFLHMHKGLNILPLFFYNNFLGNF
jgi:hypothetical protein